MPAWGERAEVELISVKVRPPPPPPHYCLFEHKIGLFQLDCCLYVLRQAWMTIHHIDACLGYNINTCTAAAEHKSIFPFISLTFCTGEIILITLMPSLTTILIHAQLLQSINPYSHLYPWPFSQSAPFAAFFPFESIRRFTVTLQTSDLGTSNNPLFGSSLTVLQNMETFPRYTRQPVLRIRYTGPRAFLTPGSGIEKNADPEWASNFSSF